MIEGNLLIRASAGTGKTFALATRFIRLLVIDGVSPESIVALTFSRAAAQEIYTKILDRLSDAAASEKGAEAERRILTEGFGADVLAEIARRPIDWSAAGFTRILRRVVDAQHAGTIATLDSFILRIVRNFPLEMGFQNAVAVLDGPGERAAVDRALRELLGRTFGTEEFIAAFRAAREGRMPRVLAQAIGQMIEREGWRAFALDHAEAFSWTVETMAAAIDPALMRPCAPPDPLAVGAFLNRASKDAADKALAKFADYIAKLPCGENPLPSGKTIALEVARALARHPAEPFVIHEKKNNKTGDVTEERYDYSPAAFAAARRDLKRAADAFLLGRLACVAAKLRLLALVERAYDASTRRTGKLTFRDFTDYSAASESSDRGLDIQNLEFRFDSAFDHWALDEFQDTSEVQWRCLRRLVESAASSGEGRTVIAVGDLKQSIYTWRGGDETPFKEMMSWRSFAPPFGQIVDSNVSHRYQQNVCAFVNAVFGRENLTAALPAERERAVSRWLADDCWKTHFPETDALGRPKAHDFVKVIGVKPDEFAEEIPKGIDVILPALGQEIARVWADHERADSGESVGVLVRRNEEGLAIAEHLRSLGLPVVWEGLNAVCDVPVVRAVMHLLRLAEHPEDAFAWTFVNTLLPVREILFPDLAEAADVSRRVAASLAYEGLARTLKEYANALCDARHGLDALAKARLGMLVRAGVDYERRDGGFDGLDGFSRFLVTSGRRETSVSSKTIRILTIHRSKGLTLDRVFVPIVESAKGSIATASERSLVYGKGRDWALPHLPADIVCLYPAIAEVVEMQNDERLLEALRTYYVALTRSRKALYVVQPIEDDGQVHFRDVIARALAGGDVSEAQGEIVVLGEKGVEPPFAACGRDGARPAQWPHPAKGGKGRVERLSPSSAGRAPKDGKVRTASALFGADYGEKAVLGESAHAAYEAIEWAEGDALAALPEAFRKAFARPDATATVWREKGYELFFRGKWETGRFDRVVFSGSGASRKATIYDFKTNAREAGESAAAFEQRMAATYAGQMRLYRHAVSCLTGLPRERVSAELLLGATASAVPIPDKSPAALNTALTSVGYNPHPDEPEEGGDIVRRG